jgi:hypothetical protein
VPNSEMDVSEDVERVGGTENGDLRWSRSALERDPRLHLHSRPISVSSFCRVLPH